VTPPRSARDIIQIFVYRSTFIGIRAVVNTPAEITLEPVNFTSSVELLAS
jgi:hypothetical protein